MCHTKTRKRAFSDRRQNKTHTPVPRLRQHALHRQRQHHDHQGNAPQRQVAALPGHRGIQRTGALQIKQEEEPQGTIYDIPAMPRINISVPPYRCGSYPEKSSMSSAAKCNTTRSPAYQRASDNP